jgi:hypothetical protein
MKAKTIRRLELDQLTIDPAVQRVEGVDTKRVARINGSFDPLALGTIIVSERARGEYVVLDGMHRCEFARAARYTKPMDAIVFTGLNLADEARLFRLYNDARMPSAISKFCARVVEGEPIATAVTGILASHGWHVGVEPHPGVVAAVDALDRVYRNAGGVLPDGEHADITDRVISTLSAAWEHDRKAVDAAMLLAVAQLYGRFGAGVDDKKLIGEMQATRPGVLIGKAKSMRDLQGGTVPAALAKILAGMHNNKRRTNLLPDWVWIR